MLDQILTEHPEVEFVQIMIDYFDWKSYLIDAKGCYDVIRKYGKDSAYGRPTGHARRLACPDARSFHRRMGTRDGEANLGRTAEAYAYN